MLTVLLVEDDDTDAFMIEKAVNDHMRDATFCRVETVAAGEDFVRRHGADVILLDLNLPDATSPAESCARMTACAGSTPVIIATHMQDRALARAFVQGGAEDFLNKQLIAMRPGHVRDAIELAIARHTGRQQAIDEKDTLLNCFMGGYSVRGSGEA